MPDLFYLSYLNLTFRGLLDVHDEGMIAYCLERLAIDMDHEEPERQASMEDVNVAFFGNFWDMDDFEFHGVSLPETVRDA